MFVFFRSKFPQPMYPSFDEMQKNVSLGLINYHFSQGNPRPKVPALIEVGGIRIKHKLSQLPEDLEIWMNKNPNGVIYFSLGTAVETNELPELQLNAIIRTFGNLKQNIIWKTAAKNFSIKLPENIKTWEWLPQGDILAQKNLKLFITHGGLGSILEARYHGVPIVGIPVFGDQMANIEMATTEGWGIAIELKNLTQENLSDAVNKILNDNSYFNQIQYLSELYKDRLIDPLDTAIFWIEYVIRHKGAKHMQANSVHLNFFQLHSIDVILVILISFLILTKIFIIFVKILFHFIFRKKLKKKTE